MTNCCPIKLKIAKIGDPLGRGMVSIYTFEGATKENRGSAARRSRFELNLVWSRTALEHP